MVVWVSKSLEEYPKKKVSPEKKILIDIRLPDIRNVVVASRLCNSKWEIEKEEAPHLDDDDGVWREKGDRGYLLYEEYYYWDLILK